MLTSFACVLTAGRGKVNRRSGCCCFNRCAEHTKERYQQNFWIEAHKEFVEIQKEFDCDMQQKDEYRDSVLSIPPEGTASDDNCIITT